MPGWGSRAGGRSGRSGGGGGDSAGVEDETPLANRNFEWQRSPLTRGNRAYREMEVSVEELDRAWRMLRVEAGGEGGIGDRYREAQNFLANNSRINMIEVVVKPNGTIDFVDGRHRFAVLRDAGVRRIRVLMRDSQNWQK